MNQPDEGSRFSHRGFPLLGDNRIGKRSCVNCVMQRQRYCEGNANNEAIRGNRSMINARPFFSRPTDKFYFRCVVFRDVDVVETSKERDRRFAKFHLSNENFLSNTEFVRVKCFTNLFKGLKIEYPYVALAGP